MERRTGSSSSTVRMLGLVAMGGECTPGALRSAMLWTIVGILLFLWLLGFILRAFGGLIHLLLIVALLIIIYRLVTNRRVF
jgi:hypothetical protein